MAVFLNGSQTQQALLDLIDDCQSFSIVTAWATPNNVFDSVKNNIDKLAEIIIGIDFYQTSPDVLRWLQKNAPGKSSIGKCKNGVFHPKLYVFRFKGDEGEVIIGSANMTRAAFQLNNELCLKLPIRIAEDSDDPLYAELNLWRKNSTRIAGFDVDAYAEKYNSIGSVIRKESNLVDMEGHDFNCEDDFPLIAWVGSNDYTVIDDPDHELNGERRCEALENSIDVEGDEDRKYLELYARDKWVLGFAIRRNCRPYWIGKILGQIIKNSFYYNDCPGELIDSALTCQEGNPPFEINDEFVEAFRGLIFSEKYTQLRETDYQGSWFFPRLDLMRQFCIDLRCRLDAAMD